MSDNVIYQGLTFERTPSGKWLVSTNFGQATGNTPAEAVLVAADSIAYKNPNSETIQAYAAQIKEIGLDSGTNSGVTNAYQAAVTPVTTTDTATAQAPVNSTPEEPLTTQEQTNLENNAKPSLETPTTENVDFQGRAIQAGEEFITDPDTGQKFRVAQPGSPGTFGGTSTTTPDFDASNPIPNPLHAYASYTYGLSLHLLTKDQFNKIMDKQEYLPEKVLIASAGRYNNTPGPSQFIRSSHFNEDFYFDSLDLETVIAPNEQSRNSNALRYKFTLIEPYGFTLIDRIIRSCAEIGCKNYLVQPYLLQIDFFAINDAGEIIGAVPNTTKRIPIYLNKIDVNLTVRGAEYSIEGVPYNHSAFDITTISVPVHFEVEARTVSQFFQSIESEGGTTDVSGQRESAQNTLWKTTNSQLVSNGQYVATNEVNSSLLSLQSKKELGLIKSFGTALNNHYKKAADNFKIGVADKFLFKIHPDIDKYGTFSKQDQMSHRDTTMADKNNIGSIRSVKKSDLGQYASSYDPTMRLFQINAGTYIDRVISWVLCNSDYIQRQLLIPEEIPGMDPNAYKAAKEKNSNEPLQWFKIVPSIKLLDFDPVRNIYAREITYNVIPYTINNVKLDIAPQGKAKSIVKDYNYLYTGLNDDIIDLNIQFNALYYNALTLYRDNLTKVVTPNQVTEEYKTMNNQGYDGVDQDPNIIMPLVMKPITFDARDRTGSGLITARQAATSDLNASLMSATKADMLVVELKIIGDPTFIKQDDLFYQPKMNPAVTENKTNSDPRLLPDGTLRMDNGELYVNLTFRTPVDIDESNGEAKFDSSYRVSLFSGLYRVIKIKNIFQGGAFTQVLELNRLPNQGKKDSAQGKPAQSNARNSDPGGDAQLNNYLKGPDVVASDGPAAPAAESEDTVSQTGQEQTAGAAVEETPDTTPKPENQEDLKQINQTAETTPISSNTEPQATPLPPPPPAPLPTGVTQSRISGLYEYGGTTIPPIRDQDLSKVVDAMATGQDITVFDIDPVSGRQKSTTYNSSTGTFTTSLG